jgi:hypothetical protein
MIRPLRAALILVALAPVACSSGECATVGCQDGLTIDLGSGFTRGQTFELTVTDLTATPVTIATCTYAPSATADDTDMLSCASLRPHMEIAPAIQIRQWQPTRIGVKVVSGGATVAEKDFDITFTSSEINGPGCGACAQASVILSLP